MRTPRSLILFFSLVAFCCNAFSQTSVPPDSEVSNFLGEWKFVAEESYKGESDRKLYSAYMISIDRIEDKLSITREFVYNSITYTRKATIYLDGRGETNSSADSNGRTSTVRSKSKFKNGAIYREFARETRYGPADIETFRYLTTEIALSSNDAIHLKCRAMSPNPLKAELYRIDSYWNVSSKNYPSTLNV
jgi:hypothetical protein